MAAALVRTAGARAPRLPEQVRDLVAHLYVLERGEARLVTGADPPSWLEPWLRAEAAALAIPSSPATGSSTGAPGRW